MNGEVADLLVEMALATEAEHSKINDRIAKKARELEDLKTGIFSDLGHGIRLEAVQEFPFIRSLQSLFQLPKVSTQEQVAILRKKIEQTPLANLYWLLGMKCSALGQHADAEAAYVSGLQSPLLADFNMHFRIRLALLETLCDRIAEAVGSAADLARSRERLTSTARELLRHRRFGPRLASYICQQVSRVGAPALLQEVSESWRDVEPGSAEAIQYLASALFDAGAYGPAIETLDRIPPDARTWRYTWTRGRALDLIGRVGPPDRATPAGDYIKNHGETARIAPTDADDAFEYAMRLSRLGKADEAAAVLDEAFSAITFQGWRLASWHYRRGMLRPPDSEERIANFREASRLRPTRALYRLRLARALLESNQAQAALVELDESRAVADFNTEELADWYRQRALSLRHLAQLAEGLQDAVASVRESDTPTARRLVCNMLLDCGLHDECARAARTISDGPEWTQRILSDNELARSARTHARNLPVAMVAQVEPDSNAAKAGMLSGDVILAINGTEIHALDSLLAKLRPGSKHTTIGIRLQRGTKEVELTSETPVDARFLMIYPRPKEAATIELPF